MAIKIWQGDAVAVAQSGTVDIGTGHASGVYVLTATDEAGNTVAVSDTSTSATNTVIAASLADAWNASGSPVAQRVTASVSGVRITLTADTAGVPFTIASSGSGGDATIGSYTAVTANSGPNDYNTAENWADGSKPSADDDDVYLTPENNEGILWGLNQSGTEIDSFHVEPGYSGTIGGSDGGYLQLHLGNTEVFSYTGTGTAYIDVGASTISPVIERTAIPGSGKHGLYFKGTAIADFFLRRGYVGFGVEEDDTTSKCNVFYVSYMTSQKSDSHLVIGSGVTDTTAGGTTEPDVQQSGGTVTSDCDIDVLTVTGGSKYTQRGAGTQFTTGHIRAPINLSIDGNGTYVTLNLGSGCTLDNRRNMQAKTITNLNVTSNDISIHDPSSKLTLSNGVIAGTGIYLDNCYFNFGAGRTLAIS